MSAAPEAGTPLASGLSSRRPAPAPSRADRPRTASAALTDPGTRGRRVIAGYGTSRSRLADLADLEPGWLDGHGSAIRADLLDIAGQILDRCETATRADTGGLLALLPPPALFPTERGGIEFAFGLPRYGRARENHSYLEFELGEPELPDLFELTCDGEAITTAEHPWSPDDDSLIHHLAAFATKHSHYLQEVTR